MTSPIAFLRLWLAKRLLPSGYAIWTWGQEEGDELVLERGKDAIGI